MSTTQQPQITVMETSCLIPYGYNPRKNDAAVGRMARAIEAYGFRVPIIARSDGTVIDGHLRLKAALELNLSTVPVLLADDLTPEQVKAFRIIINESTNWAEWDEAKLRRELEELSAVEYDLTLTGLSTESLSELLDVSPLDLGNICNSLDPAATPIDHTQPIVNDECDHAASNTAPPELLPSPQPQNKPQQNDQREMLSCPKCGFCFRSKK